jgi:hypothetical protein
MFKKWNSNEELELSILLKNGSIYNNVLSIIASLKDKELITVNQRTF